ncbi:GMC family oxidoreductase N-terminal domain-containing protein [Peredibacter sp. HCB2-198]|uniref:GMC family oxidoreductase N-terminal domain-containing protein n=1 Tax=Peredibacter sp. HCB2-198 TaxID=3383025 RepID=UPI0038B69406
MEDNKKKVNRRDFISAGAGALAGAGFYGVLQNGQEGKQVDPSREPASNPRGPDPRNIANNFKQLKKHYPVVIIGSGYGGSVLAARLSAQGKQVCVLERGREWHPGMFPKDGGDLTKVAFNKMNPKGLVDSNIHKKSNVDIICASGLGGTSLLNAAIASRPEALVWQQKDWPKEIREDFANGKITSYMNKAQKVLASTHHPDAMKVRKTQLHKQMGEELGVPVKELLLNVNHTFDKQKNDYGVVQNACTMCGDCCSGCNVGAKNVLTVNYLPLAKSQGAEIYTMMDVSYVEKTKEGKYVIHYINKEDKEIEGVITADVLIMAAGSMGTTQIMMRSRFKGLRLSEALGSRFSANGDIMGFSYNGLTQTDILGHGLNKRSGSTSGQAIMVYADYRSEKYDPKNVDLMERYLLLDGTVPSALGPMVSKAFAAWALANSSKFSDEQMKKVRRDLFDTAEPDTDGAINNSLIFFACGHDSSNGRYRLDDFDDRVHVVWPNVINEKGFQTINREMAKYAKAHGGIYVPNPRMTVFGHRMMATHPLGGCPMGDDAQTGVVDHYGRVFTEDGKIHKGFFVVDAAILPRSLGATPLLTVSALAERIADHINSDHTLRI